jgi:uncharacterized membrane protein YdbT with pleckstrin-like domain
LPRFDLTEKEEKAAAKATDADAAAKARAEAKAARDAEKAALEAEKKAEKEAAAAAKKAREDEVRISHTRRGCYLMKVIIRHLTRQNLFVRFFLYIVFLRLLLPS